MELHKALWFVLWRFLALLFLATLFVLAPGLYLGLAKGFEPVSLAALLMYWALLACSLLGLLVVANTKFSSGQHPHGAAKKAPVMKAVMAVALLLYAGLYAYVLVIYPHGRSLGSYMYGLPLFAFGGYVLYRNFIVYRNELTA